MTKFEKVIHRILRGTSDKNIRFEELRFLLKKMNFNERIKGGHHIFTRKGVEEIINIQPSGRGKAKPYQVKEILLHNTNC